MACLAALTLLLALVAPAVAEAQVCAAAYTKNLCIDNTPADAQCLTYQSATQSEHWASCGAGGGVSGTGTSGTLAAWTGASSIGNAGNPANCSANQAAGGIDATGAAESCVAPVLANGSIPLTSDWALGSHKITAMTDPAALQDAATKNYVDQVAGGLEARQARLATAAALPSNTYNNGVLGIGATLTATANAALTVDGTAVATADRVLVKNEATAANNGIYTVTQTGSGILPYILTRSIDSDDSDDFAGVITFISAGSANVNTAWLVAAGASITVGTTALSYSQYQVGQGTTVGGDLTGTVGNATLSSGNAGNLASGNLAGARAPVCPSQLVLPFGSMGTFGPGGAVAVPGTVGQLICGRAASPCNIPSATQLSWRVGTGVATHQCATAIYAYTANGSGAKIIDSGVQSCASTPTALNITGLTPGALTAYSEYFSCFAASTNATMTYNPAVTANAAINGLNNFAVLGPSGATAVAQFNAACTASVTPYACCTGIQTGTCTGMPATIGTYAGTATNAPAYILVD